jgi:hypothetical protein
MITNSGPQTSTFTPGASDWIVANADLSAFAGKNNVRVKFVSVNGYGNNLYLDDIEFREPWAVSNGSELVLDSKMFTSPNPFVDGFSLHVIAPAEETLEVSLMDITGRKIWSGGAFSVIAGKNELQLTPSGLAPGVYLVKVQNLKGVAQTLKVVKE